MIPELAAFASALAADFLACEWHAARQRGRVAGVALLSALTEALTWVPLYAVVVTGSASVVACAVLGAVIGGSWGAARERARLQPPGVTLEGCDSRTDPTSAPPQP